MNLLLDTQVVLWWLGDPASLSPRCREAIADPDNTVFLSAVVVWECRIKQSLGKLDLPQEFAEVLSAQPFVPLPVTVEHAHALQRLPPIHRDPFDRMLVAQALCGSTTIVTRDPSIHAYPVHTLEA